MNVEIGAEAALFPEKEYINGIAVAVYAKLMASIYKSVGPPVRDNKLMKVKNIFRNRPL